MKFKAYGVDEENIKFVYLGIVEITQAEVKAIPFLARNRPRVAALKKARQQFDDVRLVEEMVDSEEFESSPD